VDDLRFGRTFRAARLKRGWRQVDLADRAGVSRGSVSRIERGQIEELSFGIIRRVARALDMGLELMPRSRRADLDRVLSARHSALAEAMLASFALLSGWVVRPEVSFSIWGERGIVDLLAWHAPTGTLLVIELKTAIVDVGEILGTFDRKLRLARQVAEELGWRVSSVSGWLVVANSMSNRRRVAEHRGTFRAALPDDGRRVRRWLDRPEGRLRALSFVSDARRGSVRSGFATPTRVATRSPRPPRRPAVRSTPA
jgi:transcriptional regulator with XRE-family HTH domain